MKSPPRPPPPLSIIFTKSMSSGVVPEDWRVANVTAIYKKGQKSSQSNYHPISLTSVPVPDYGENQRLANVPPSVREPEPEFLAGAGAGEKAPTPDPAPGCCCMA